VPKAKKMMNLMKIKTLLQSATSVTSNLKRCKILPSQNLAHELTLVVRLSLKKRQYIQLETLFCKYGHKTSIKCSEIKENCAINDQINNTKID
jgi:hypothetical protein